MLKSINKQIQLKYPNLRLGKEPYEFFVIFEGNEPIVAAPNVKQLNDLSLDRWLEEIDNCLSTIARFQK